MEFEKEVPVHEFIMHLHRCSAKSWRCQRQDVKQCIKQAFLSVASQFHNLVEDMDAEEWRNADPLTLHVMRLASKRARRVSKFYKQALVAAAKPPRCSNEALEPQAVPLFSCRERECGESCLSKTS